MQSLNEAVDSAALADITSEARNVRSLAVEIEGDEVMPGTTLDVGSREDVADGRCPTLKLTLRKCWKRNSQDYPLYVQSIQAEFTLCYLYGV